MLTEYSNTLPVESRDFQRKDGVLVALAVLFKILADSKAYRPMLEPLIVAHVLPEFQSPVGNNSSRRSSGSSSSSLWVGGGGWYLLNASLSLPFSIFCLSPITCHMSPL